MLTRLFLSCWLGLLVLGSPHVVAQSLIRGPYLQMGTDTEITVRWRTSNATDGWVDYGPSLENPADRVEHTNSTGEHELTISALSPDRKYYYAIGHGDTKLAGDSSYFFVTAPAPGTRKKTRIWVIGDSGTADAAARAVRDAYTAYTGSRHTDLWVMLGDNAYDDGTESEYQRSVFDTYPEMLRKSVLWPAFGNHDARSATSAFETGVFYDIFTLPRDAEAGGVATGTEAYYSFEYGNLHFICLNSDDVNRSVSGAMLTWLQDDLAANDKDWTIAFWHHPPYSKGSHNSDTENKLIGMRQNALPILEKGGVDLVLSGHSHSYERSFLLDGHYAASHHFDPGIHAIDDGDGREDGNGAYSKPTFGAPASHEGAVYVVAGSSGKTSGGSLDHPAIFYAENVLGSVILEVDSMRLDLTFLNWIGTTSDHFTLLKGGGGSNQSPVANANGTYSDSVGNIIRFSSAGSFDPDGTLSSYLWHFGDGQMSTAANPSHTYAAVGTYNVILTVTDNSGARGSDGTTAAVSSATDGEILIARGATWSYKDDGSDQGSAWRNVSFDDTGWLSGAGQLGFGDGDEATVLHSGHITYYFRHSFDIDNRSKYKSLSLDLLRDDGAVVYLNGIEIERSNMTSGTITAATFASSTISGTAEDRFTSSVESIDGLVPGNNVIAVEIHQRSLGSSDVSFDLGLEATVDMPTGISIAQENVPQDFVLFQPYPNPFNPETTISLAIPKTALVEVKVYNFRGQLIRTFVDREVLTQGMYKYVWEGRSNEGNLVSSGVYIVQMAAGDFRASRKVVLLK